MEEDPQKQQNIAVHRECEELAEKRNKPLSTGLLLTASLSTSERAQRKAWCAKRTLPHERLHTTARLIIHKVNACVAIAAGKVIRLSLVWNHV